jgi:GMP synthase (glutamine-hydrolysing)
MHIHYFQHVPFENLGSIQTWAEASGHPVTSTRFYEPHTLPNLDRIDWLVVMGGPMNIYDVENYPWLTAEKRLVKEAIDNNKIVIGVCLGAQLIADVLGAEIYPNQHKEIGWFPIQRSPALSVPGIGDVIPAEMKVFHWHGDTFDLPKSALLLAGSAACKNQAFIYNERVFGFQFHLEITKDGAERLIANCADEIVEAPYIQTAEFMLSDQDRFHEINGAMNKVLDYLERIQV